MQTKDNFIGLTPEVVYKIKEQMLQQENFYNLAELFKIFCDSTRIKILFLLLQSEMCVYDIALLLNMTQSSISHQLRILKQNKLVKFRKEGKSVYYSLADNHVFNILEQGFEHLSE